jgi:hypothetical protein
VRPRRDRANRTAQTSLDGTDERYTLHTDRFEHGIEVVHLLFERRRAIERI